MRKLAIMQPYFFPYVGYFALMHYAKEFILFDTAQYDRKGWMNRNRILKPDAGWQYFRAGIQKPEYCTSINQVVLLEGDEWKEVILRQIVHYRKIAPHCEMVSSWLKSLLMPRRITLVELNKDIIEATLALIGMNCPLKIFSQMNLRIGEVRHAGQWALRICEALGADEYVNPLGGRGIFAPQEFADSGIRLRFLRHNLPEYPQGNRKFEPGLSILDVLMFNTVEETRSMIENYVIEDAQTQSVEVCG